MTDILESPLFKHNKPIKEKTELIIKQEDNFLTEQFIKTCFTIPKELKAEYTFLGQQIKDMPYKPEIDDWIQCRYRERRYLGKRQGVESYCHNIEHPAFNILWSPICLKNKCDLPKCEDNL